MQMTSGKRAVDKIYRRRDRYDIPDWQREEVWDAAKKSLLIDSMLRGWKLPKFYFLKSPDEAEEYEVVDGQQRLSAIFEFFDDELGLDAPSSDEFGGTIYSALPQTTQDRLDDFELEFDVIENAKEEEIKQFFQRLQAGLPLTSSEKLNAVHSNLRDFSKKLAKQSFFKNKVHLADKHYAHFDIASKVAAIEVDGLDTSLRYDDLKDLFESQAAFSPKSQVAKRLVAGFDYLDKVFPARTPILRHRTIIQSFATLAIQLVSGGKADGYEGRLREFFESFMKELSRQVEMGSGATDPNYLAFQRTVNANVRSGAKIRAEVLMRQLMLFDPQSAELLGPTLVAESGLTQAISQIAKAIQVSVESVNTRYAANNSVDLITSTNKTVGALARLGAPICSYDEYKALVDDLYFLFH